MVYYNLSDEGLWGYYFKSFNCVVNSVIHCYLYGFVFRCVLLLMKAQFELLRLKYLKYRQIRLFFTYLSIKR